MVTSWPDGHPNHCALCAKREGIRLAKLAKEELPDIWLEDSAPHSWKPDGNIETEIQK